MKLLSQLVHEHFMAMYTRWYQSLDGTMLATGGMVSVVETICETPIEHCSVGIRTWTNGPWIREPYRADRMVNDTDDVVIDSRNYMSTLLQGERSGYEMDPDLYQHPSSFRQYFLDAESETKETDELDLSAELEITPEDCTPPLSILNHSYFDFANKYEHEVMELMRVPEDQLRTVTTSVGHVGIQAEHAAKSIEALKKAFESGSVMIPKGFKAWDE